MNEEKNTLLEQFMKIHWLFMRNHHHHGHNHTGYGYMKNPYRGQGRVLKLLRIKPEMTQRELSELLGIRPQSLGDLLKKLEQNGYITRTPSEDDKRAMIISLTEKGKTEEIVDEKQLGFDAMFECLSKEEQATLGEYLQRIIDAWKSDRENEPDFDFRNFHHRHHHHHHHKEN